MNKDNSQDSSHSFNHYHSCILLFTMQNPCRLLIFGCVLIPVAMGGGGGVQNRKTRLFILSKECSFGANVLMILEILSRSCENRNLGQSVYI